ncbi:hypothetical protein BSKO_03496 [Bryopsis sp. KO-2023]|nr:hypothetical protein BSKO_03496 [Bryopsis sp. KO-2023]
MAICRYKYASSCIEVPETPIHSRHQLIVAGSDQSLLKGFFQHLSSLEEQELYDEGRKVALIAIIFIQQLMGPTWTKYKGGVETLKNLPLPKRPGFGIFKQQWDGCRQWLEVLENIHKLTIRCDGISLYNMSALPANLEELHLFGIGFVPGPFKNAPSKLQALEIFH